jgi:hypothetical protein
MELHNYYTFVKRVKLLTARTKIAPHKEKFKICALVCLLHYCLLYQEKEDMQYWTVSIFLLWLALSSATPPHKCDSKPPSSPLPDGEYDFIVVGGGKFL